MDLNGTRVTALITLFVLTMLAGLGPVLVFNLWRRKQDKAILESHNSGLDVRKDSKSSKSAKILQLLLVFGGGVLLSTCFVHMIPEIQESYNAYQESKEHHEDVTTISPVTETTSIPTVPAGGYNKIQNVRFYHPGHDESGEEGHSHSHSHSPPWVEICICLGLFLTYFIEESILLLIGRESSHHHHHHHNHHQQNHHDLSVESNHKRRTTSCYSENNLPHGGLEDYGSITNNGSRRLSSNSIEKHAEIKHKIGYDNVAIDLRGDNLSPTSLHRSYSSIKSIAGESNWTLFLRGLIIVIAFLAHSIFDGVAIGLQTSSYSIWTMFFAICLHKFVVVFAIGFELFEKTGSLLFTSIHMTIFSAMSPLGIFLTIVIEKGLSEDGSLTLILLNAVATGAILYIVFLEILQADRCPEVNGLVQLLFLMAGFTLMTCMTVLVGHGD